MKFKKVVDPPRFAVQRGSWTEVTTVANSCVPLIIWARLLELQSLETMCPDLYLVFTLCDLTICRIFVCIVSN
jgi:hypothetical protein